ncbi:MAG: NAD(P)H-hydrate dehydratase [Muribaculum sp.]|nr:NAD(P)H-hydrate dehydratase [Muribaculum sp.]
MKIFTNEQIRAIEQYTIEKEGVASTELIERAASAMTAEITSRWRQDKKVWVFAGHGNNGADALVVARMLIERGYTVETLLFNVFNRLSEGCSYARKRLLELGDVNFMEVTGDFTPPVITPGSVVIDGLFGSGLREALTGGFRSLVDYINNSKAKIVSIDVPSGLFAEWNEDNLRRNIIHADLTLAVQFPRLSFFIADNAEFLGEWKVLDIGLSSSEIKNTTTQYFLLEKHDARRLLHPRGEFSSKADYGSAMIVGGSFGMLGAAQLAARGALRAGVGKLTVHVPRCGFTVMQTAVPEAMVQVDHNDSGITEINLRHEYDAIALGPGMGTHDLTVRAVETFVNHSTKPLLIDADGLNCIAQRPMILDMIPPMSVITPHAGEFDRLFGEHMSHEARIMTAMQKAQTYNIVILLKGHYTTIVRPDHRLFFTASGSPALATPGSGDVLTGIIAGLLAQGYSSDLAATLGAYIHGYAGTLAAGLHGEYGVLASDIADSVGVALRDIMK